LIFNYNNICNFIIYILKILKYLLYLSHHSQTFHSNLPLKSYHLSLNLNNQTFHTLSYQIILNSLPQIHSPIQTHPKRFSKRLLKEFKNKLKDVYFCSYFTIHS